MTYVFRSGSGVLCELVVIQIGAGIDDVDVLARSNVVVLSHSTRWCVPPRSRVNASRRQSRRRKEPVVKNLTTYVGVDAHKKDLFVAMLNGQATAPVMWQLANEPAAVRRLVRRLERAASGPVQVF